MTNSITTKSERLIPIPEYEGRYSATSDGHIYSHITDKVLSEKPHSSGYSSISLMGFDGKRHDLLVHRLICLAFHGAPKQDQTDVNHINCDKKDNRPENLEWCSRKENMRHAMIRGRLTVQRKAVAASNRINKSVAIAGFDANGNECVRFPSIADAIRHGYKGVWNAMNGRSKTCNGLYWRRIQAYDELHYDEVGI